MIGALYEIGQENTKVEFIHLLKTLKDVNRVIPDSIQFNQTLLEFERQFSPSSSDNESPLPLDNIQDTVGFSQDQGNLAKHIPVHNDPVQNDPCPDIVESVCPSDNKKTKHQMRIEEDAQYRVEHLKILDELTKAKIKSKQQITDAILEFEQQVSDARKKHKIEEYELEEQLMERVHKSKMQKIQEQMVMMQKLSHVVNLPMGQGMVRNLIPTKINPPVQKKNIPPVPSFLPAPTEPDGTRVPKAMSYADMASAP